MGKVKRYANIGCMDVTPNPDIPRTHACCELPLLHIPTNAGSYRAKILVCSLDHKYRPIE